MKSTLTGFHAALRILLVGMVASAPSMAATTGGISPAFGHPGDVVQISGSGFDPNPSNDVVRFGPNRAAVLSATSSQLTVQVPNGQPLGPTIVSLNSVTVGTFFTVTNAKIASLPANPVAGCQ